MILFFTEFSEFTENLNRKNSDIFNHHRKSLDSKTTENLPVLFPVLSAHPDCWKVKSKVKVISMSRWIIQWHLITMVDNQNLSIWFVWSQLSDWLGRIHGNKVFLFFMVYAAVIGGNLFTQNVVMVSCVSALRRQLFNNQRGSVRLTASKLINLNQVWEKQKNENFSSSTFTTVFKICPYGRCFDSSVYPHGIF